jgi:hypothetical protein
MKDGTQYRTRGQNFLRENLLIARSDPGNDLDPSLVLDLFTSRTFNVCVAIGFAFMIGFYGVPFLFSLYFQQIRGIPPAKPAWRSCR